MSHPIELPHVGESVTEAIIGKWLKKPGDRIEKYDPLVEVVTDKVTMEVPAPATGTLTRIVAGEGATIQMGAVIAEMDYEGAGPALSAHSASIPPSTPAQGPAPLAPHAAALSGRPSPDRIGQMIMGANVGPTGGVFQDTSLAANAGQRAGHGGATAGTGGADATTLYSPVVMRLAVGHRVDLSTIKGTGLGGRVTKKDVLDAAAAGKGTGGPVKPAAFSDRPAGAPPFSSPLTLRERRSPDAGLSTSKAPVEVAGAKSAAPDRSASEDRLIELSPVRKLIAAHMARSRSEIPHAWSTVEVDATGLVACRSARRERFLADTGVDLTYLAFTLHAVAQALRGNPLLNSRWEGGRVRLKARVNVGIAVAGRDGLVVPVIHDADRSTVAGLARRLAPVIARARDGKLTLEDVQGGTFTLNNTGALGSVLGGAIINHPQAAVLTTEAINKRPAVVTGPGGDTIVVRSMMNICLSFDHRVMDGAEAAAFMQEVRRRLEAIAQETPIE